VSDLCGTITADAGYLIKEEYKTSYGQRTRFSFKTRSCIETVWDVLKERSGIIINRARSLQGLSRHYSYSLVAYMFYSDGHLLLHKA